MQTVYASLKLFLLMILLTGLLYPLIITALSLLIMPRQAKGSLVQVNGRIIGSELIAQKFASDSYFWPRPSANDYNALSSGGSNLGPTSQKLKKIVQERVQTLAKFQPSHSTAIPSELVYASGSGLDPHINLQTAYFQIERVAKARSLANQDQLKLKTLIDSLVEGRQLGFIGPQYVNVLRLNQALDQNFPIRRS